MAPDWGRSKRLSSSAWLTANHAVLWSYKRDLVDVISLKPERRAQLEEFARQHGKDAADALDDALAAFFEGELRDFEEAAEGIRRGYEDVRAGRHRSAREFLQELRVKHDLPR